MVTLKEAYSTAQKEFPGYKLVECVDIGKAYAFYFSPGKEAVPGIPYIAVSKASGSVDYLTIPPVENLALIQKGKKIKIK